MPTVTRLLIANRGEIACRIARTAQAMGIATVAVYSDPDARAVHVAAADEAVPLGGATPAGSYLDPGALIAAARHAGADAVHPGYGFLSENAGFAAACLDAGLVWVGPSPDVIAAMGDKLAAKARMGAAGVPVLPSYELDGAGGPAAAGAVPDGAWPLIVKAAAGGGGRGMRVVAEPSALASAVAAARREALAAFGDDRVFAEPYRRGARHVEVQVLGDAHGTVVALGERECSVQRRHQKVIEESPSPAVDDALRERLSAAAVTAAHQLGYVGAGTVEFVLDTAGFAFLEVNTRLQVEHPVTELAWGVRGHGDLDLVREQLRVARGEPLGYGQPDVERRGHAVEARLYAEDPVDFLPAAGTVDVWRPASGPGVRVDAGVAPGSVVGVDYDPLLAKVIGAATTRAEAVDVLAAALTRTWVAGVVTNRDLLRAVLDSATFRSGRATTRFLDDHRESLAAAMTPTVERLWWHAAAAALASADRRRRHAPVLAAIPSGWRNNPSQPQRITYEGPGGHLEVDYAQARGGTWTVAVAGNEAPVRVWAVTPDTSGAFAGGWAARIDLETGGLRRTVSVADAGYGVHVHSTLGADTLLPVPRHPARVAAEPAGSLRAPMPGTVRHVAVAAGDAAAEGDLLVVLEAMKMEHRVTATGAGRVADVRVAPGDTVAAGDVLVVLDG